jgi:hypothetical protein
MIRIVTIAALFTTAALAQAPAAAPAPSNEPPPPAPTSDEVNKVIAYYNRGAAAGPVLMEFSLCTKAERVEGRLACIEKLPPKIKKGDTIIAYVKFFAPKGGKYEDIKVKFMLDGEVRSTSDMSVTEAFSGYANYKQSTASKAGKWEIQVLRGEKVVGTQSVQVE